MAFGYVASSSGRESFKVFQDRKRITTLFSLLVSHRANRGPKMAKHTPDRRGHPVVSVPAAAAASPGSVIRYLVRQLVLRDRLAPEQADRAAEQVIARERRKSTALAGGAVPHCQTEVPHPVGIVGRLAVPVSWPSPDNLS